MNRITVEWDRLRDGKFPKQELEELGVIVGITPISRTVQKITLLEPDETTLESAFKLGMLVQSYKQLQH